ncbi:MAG: hypothetical protein IPG56_17535 [Caulobacteraceae bacterium]|nr:hypothetical protein [Caulobacteraceae bacterium]
MSVWRYAVAACVIALAACDQQPPDREAEGSTPSIDAPSETTDAPRAEIPPVDALLLGAPNDAFTAIEPSEVGVFGAPAVMEALEPLLGPEVMEGADVSLSCARMVIRRSLTSCALGCKMTRFPAATSALSFGVRPMAGFR